MRLTDPVVWLLIALVVMALGHLVWPIRKQKVEESSGCILCDLDIAQLADDSGIWHRNSAGTRFPCTRRRPCL